jgi:hypothetical protein
LISVYVEGGAALASLEELREVFKDNLTENEIYHLYKQQPPCKLRLVPQDDVMLLDTLDKVDYDDQGDLGCTYRGYW